MFLLSHVMSGSSFPSMFLISRHSQFRKNLLIQDLYEPIQIPELLGVIVTAIFNNIICNSANKKNKRNVSNERQI